MAAIQRPHSHDRRVHVSRNGDVVTGILVFVGYPCAQYVSGDKGRGAAVSVDSAYSVVLHSRNDSHPAPSERRAWTAVAERTERYPRQSGNSTCLTPLS